MQPHHSLLPLPPLPQPTALLLAGAHSTPTGTEHIIIRQTGTSTEENLTLYLNIGDTTPNAVCNNSAKGLGILQSTLALYMQYVICLFEDILHTAHSPSWL
jgi:hypothetical protein